MKHFKTLSIVAAVAAALMAFVGASTASATVLCSEAGTGSPTGTTCPPGKAYSAGTQIHAVNVGSVKLDTTFKTITCTESTVKGFTTNEGSATETVDDSESGAVLTFTGCNCEVFVFFPGTLEIHWISGSHNGTVTSSEALVTVKCSTIFGPVHCTYATSNTDVGTLTGGQTATLNASAHIPVDEENSDEICPEESTWTASYSVRQPDALFVTGHT